MTLRDCRDGDVVTVLLGGVERELQLMQRYQFGAWGVCPVATALRGRLAGEYFHLDDDQVVLGRRAHEAGARDADVETDPLLRGSCVEPLLGGRA